MACKQEASVVRVDGFERPETQEKTSDEAVKLTHHVENVVRTWALVKTDLEGNGTVFYLRLVVNLVSLNLPTTAGLFVV